MNGREKDLPSRPSLPPLFIAAVCAWIAAQAAEAITWQKFLGTQDEAYTNLLPLFLAFIGIALAAGFILKRKNKRQRSLYQKRRSYKASLLIGALGFAAVFACALLYWNAWEVDVEQTATLSAQGNPFILELTGDPSIRDYGIVSSAQMDLNGRKIKVRLTWPEDSEPLYAGNQIEVSGSFKASSAEGCGRWAHQNGYVGSIKVQAVQSLGASPSLQGMVSAFRNESFDRLRTFEGDASGLLAGVVLGNRTIYTGTELEQAFQTTGLAHLMAVSGTHLAVVTMLLALLLSKTALRRVPRDAILIFALVLYVALTAFSPSALRACIMCAVALTAGLFKRRKSILNGLALCVVVFIGLSPPIIFTLGFQLSVLAVLGLVLFSPLMQAWVERVPVLENEVLSAPIAATLAATLMTLPVTIPQFAQLPLISPVANIIVAPLITCALSLGIIGALLSVLIAPMGELVLAGAAAIANVCAFFVRLLSDIPGACLPLAGSSIPFGFAFALLAILLWIIWPLPPVRPGPISLIVEQYDKPSKGFRDLPSNALLGLSVLVLPLAIALLLGFGSGLSTAIESRSKVVMLDVGQGDSMLISSMGANILIDTGEKGEVLLSQLARQKITHLDAIIITHKDADHAGALKELAGVVGVEHVYIHEDLLDDDFEYKVLEAAQWVTHGKGAEGIGIGDHLNAGEFTLTVLSPREGGESENADSLVHLLEYDEGNNGSIEARGLLTGDAEGEAVKEAVKSAGDIDFLKVAHHGSKGGLTDDELSTLRPEIALISVGEKNKYGHPTSSTLKQLENAGAKIYRTDKQGAITLGFTREGMSVSTDK